MPDFAHMSYFGTTLIFLFIFVTPEFALKFSFVTP